MGIRDWWNNRKITGTPFDDRLRDTYRSDQIDGLGGNDRIFLSYGDDQVNGGDGRDIVEIRGSLDEWEITIPQFFAPTPPGEHMIILTHPRYGEKTLTYVEQVIDANGRILKTGQYYTNRIEGTEGDDDLVDTPGNDIINSKAGDDIIILTTGDDRVYDNSGVDIVELQGTFADYNFYWEDTGMLPVVPDAIFYSEEYGEKRMGYGVEYVRDSTGEMQQLWPTSIVGTAGDDTIRDTIGDDQISTMQGNNTVYLTTGNDKVYGLPGEDTIHITGTFDDYDMTTEVFQVNDLVERLVTMESEIYGDKQLSNVEFIKDSEGETIEVADLFV